MSYNYQTVNMARGCRYNVHILNKILRLINITHIIEFGFKYRTNITIVKFLNTILTDVLIQKRIRQADE